MIFSPDAMLSQAVKVALGRIFFLPLLLIAIPALRVIFKKNLKLALDLEHPKILHLIPISYMAEHRFQSALKSHMN